MKRKKELDYENLNEVISLSKKILKAFFAVIILFLIAIFIYLCKETRLFNIILNVLGVASPFFIGLVIAWLLDPMVTFLTKKKVNRTLASIFVFFLFIVIMYLFFRIMVPMLYTQINEFVSMLPNLFLQVSNFIHEFFNKLGNSGIDFDTIEKNIYQAVESFSISLTTSLPSTIIDTLTKIVSSVGSLLIGLVAGFYLLIDFDGISHFLEFVPKKYHDTAKYLGKQLNGTFRDFVQGALTISFIEFIICTIGFSIVKLPSPMLFGLICGLTNLIPYIGPWIGGAIAVIVGLTVSPIVGILTGVIAVIVQQLDSILFQPLIMGKTMKLHPVTIMIGLLIFGYFFGIIGMILATPCIAALKIILAYIDQKYDIREKIKNGSLESSD